MKPIIVRFSRTTATACNATRPLTLHIEELGFVVFFAVLFMLGLTDDTPGIFEPIYRSRLTFLMLLALPAVVLWAVIVQRFTRMRSFFFDWWQVVATVGVYESLKHLHANRITEWLSITPKDALMLRIDEMMFGMALPLRLEWLASERFTHLMWFFYFWVYYLGPLLMLSFVYFILEDDDLFLQLRKALVIGLLGGYVFYLLVPVAGPLFLIGDQFTRPIITQPLLQKLEFDTLRYNWDCFPSLHTAIPWLLMIVTWRRLGKTGRTLSAIAVCGVTLSTVVLRFHYGIDVIAGIAWAIIVVLVVKYVQWVREPISLPFEIQLPRLSKVGK